MNGRTLYWGLHWGQPVQMQLAEGAFTDVGEKHQHDHQNRGETPPGELCFSGTCNPIRVDISTARHLGHVKCVCGTVKNDLGNLFALYFLHKKENPLTHSRNSKYDANKCGWTWPPESSDISKGEIPNIPSGERGTD